MSKSKGNELLAIQKQQEYEKENPFSLFKAGKNLQVQLISLHYTNIEQQENEKKKNIYIYIHYLQIRKNVQVQPMSFGYINAETKI